MIPPYFLRIIYEQQEQERTQNIQYRKDSSEKKDHQSAWPARFFTIWFGQSLAMITSETVQFALIWWLTETYGSAIVISIATMMALLPRALLGPLVGVLADRWNRRKVLLASHIVIILALAVLGLVFRVGVVSVGVIYLVILVCACSKSFQMPAMMASTSLMVPQKHLSQIAGLNQMVQGIMRVAAPALGAALVTTLPMHAIVLVDITGAFLAILVLLFVSIPEPLRDIQGGWKSLWLDLRLGVRYVREWRGAVEMLSISTAINFLSCPAFMMTSILVTQRFNGTVGEFGVMGAAIGFGMICGGMLLSFWSGFHRPMQTSLAGIIGMALAMMFTGLAPDSAFWMAAAGMFAGGFMAPVCMAPIQALIQKSVEPALQGRVLTLFDSISTAISPLSLVLAGPVFERMGAPAWYVGGGLLSLIIGIAGFTLPRVVNLGEVRATLPSTLTVKKPHV